MIPVTPQPEPPHFDSRCRKPGEAFLRRIPKPKSREFERHWSHVLDDLYGAYKGICSLCARWVPRGKRSGSVTVSVDHYIPKTEEPKLAYEWSNFRLAHSKLNMYKGNHLDVIDPFYIKYDWFVIDFSTFYIRPAAGLPDYLKSAVEKTISRLRLNDDDDFVQERINLLRDYSLNSFPYDFLERKYPFIAYELRRQGLEQKIKSMIRPKPTRTTAPTAGNS